MSVAFLQGLGGRPGSDGQSGKMGPPVSMDPSPDWGGRLGGSSPHVNSVELFIV